MKESDRGGERKVEQTELPQLLEPHPSLPGLSGQVEVCHKSERGRHTVAVSRIEPGQLVARDDIVSLKTC